MVDKINNNRGFTNDELISLFKDLKVFDDANEDIIKMLGLVDGKLGNSLSQVSMNELTLLLIRLQVDVWDSNNIKIISRALNNKKSLNSMNISFYMNNLSLENYVRMIMLDLGLKPHLSGFELFKDAVLCLLSNNEGNIGFGRNIYTKLGEVYNINAFNVERSLRTLVNSAYSNHFDNDVCKYVYGFRDKITVVECIRLVVSYIRFNLKNNNILLDVNSYGYNYCGGDDAVLIKSKVLNSSRELEIEIDKLLNDLGISYKIVGFYYLNDAILHTLANGDLGGYMEFSNYLASTYNTTRYSVDRCIRYAISKCRENMQETLFNGSVNDIVKFMSKYGSAFIPSEFIAVFCEYIRLVVDDNIVDEYRKSNQIQALKKIKK